MLVALRSAIQDLVHPERAGDAGIRRAFLDEATESNAGTVRWLVLFLGPMHALVIFVALRFLHGTDPARAGWLSWLVGINTVLLGAVILGANVAWGGRPAALYRILGDLGGAVYLLGCGAMTANAQRANPNVSLFIISAFFIAFRMRMRIPVYVTSLLAAAALVLAAMTRFRSDVVLRTADYLTVLSVSAISLFAFFLTRRMRFREVLARYQIQQLNARLDEKIRERSRELSIALSRLAEGHQDLHPGAVLGGRVELGEPLGRGGMGIVYRGRDLLTGEAVAVKVVQAGSAGELDGLHRFLREVQIVASVTHSAIVRSIHVDVSDEGRLFQVMELVEGETLESRLARGGPLPWPAAARLGAVLAEGLAAAHAARVIHLDVKPSNIILTRVKPGLKLLDFGISALRDVRAIHLGTEGRILGTPEFMSPEQVGDPSRLEERADIYALGLVLYVAIAGRMPFEAASPPAWILAHTMHSPRDLEEIVPEIAPDLARIVMSCLRKVPGERHPASAIVAMLSAVADSAEVAPLEELDLLTPPGPMSGPNDLRPITDPAARTQPSPELSSA